MECQVLQQGSDQWRALTELYPQICDKPPARPPAIPAQKPPAIPSAPETQLACPHCQSPIVNDGSMSGQVVACPSCDGQLQMPALPGQVAAAPAQDNVEQQLAAISDLDHKLRIKKHREAAEKEGGGLETALDVLSLFG